MKPIFQIYGVFKNETICFGGAAKNLENRTQPTMLSPWARYIQIQMCTEAMCHASGDSILNDFLSDARFPIDD